MTTNVIPVGMVPNCFFVAGPMQTWVNSGASGAMELLGWTRNGLSIQEQAVMADLKSDYDGGEQGIAGDFQFLGYSHTIDCELSRFDPLVLGKLERRFNVSITNVQVGSLMRCSGANWKVLFIGVGFARLYTNVFINEPITVAPIGSPASFPRIVFTGLQDLSTNSSGSQNTADGFPWKSTGWSVSGSGVTLT